MIYPLPALAPSLDLADATRRVWDVVVVGAGPAGSMAARQLALGGANVLLVDKATFPRYKVCGCCLSSAALAALNAAGLGDLPARAGARPLRQIVLAAERHQASLHLAGASLSRSALDTHLIQAAMESGASFLPATLATLVGADTSGRQLHLASRDLQVNITAHNVIAADGVCGGLLHRERGFQRRGPVQSRIGAGAVVETANDFYRTGAIYMAAAQHGYVGLVRLEDGRLDIAAALDVAVIKREGGLPDAVAKILSGAGFPAIERLSAADWHGTPPLTRSTMPVAGDRLFAIGDAAGYVEPFTGEGIAWALASALAVAPLVLSALADRRAYQTALSPRSLSAEAQWISAHQRLLGSRMRSCRAVASLLRQPWVAGLAVRALARFPGLAAPLLRSLHKPLFRRTTSF